MTQLIRIRQRIKAVSTIRKITSAMRLISRSFHTRMYREQTHYRDYQAALGTLFSQVLSQAPTDTKLPFSSESSGPGHELIIIVGSQKGLCGNFNAPLFYWIDTHKDHLQSHLVQVVAVGKKVTDHLHRIATRQLITLPELKLSSITTLTEKIFSLVTAGDMPYERVTIISCSPKSLFSQECREQQIIPFTSPSAALHPTPDYSWTHTPQPVLALLVRMHLNERLRNALFSSLLAEYNARFTAMDSATRNAENFLDIMKIQFNKMRQAKITKELTELAGAFEIQSLV